MTADLGRFEAFYLSPLQHPGLLGLAVAAALAAVLARRAELAPSLRRYLLALVALSLADAWLTSEPVPGLGSPLPGALGGAVPIFFVLAGDFRYLLLPFAATPRGAFAPDALGVARAAALTLVVPILAQIVSTALSLEARGLFLVYELAFLALAAALAHWHPAVRATPWLRAVTRFVMLYYALWATADAWILATGSDAGFALRVVPNLLYYGGLIAAIAWLAPRRPREAA